MSELPRFELVPVERLRIHEEIRSDGVANVLGQIRRDGRVDQPILVASEGYVILDGHHRFAALRALGARRVPAWIVDYRNDGIRLERWTDGPAITKDEVLARGVEGRPFPPKTTRHRLAVPMPAHPTPLAELLRSG